MPYLPTYLGQTKPVQIINLVTHSTIEERICDLVAGKKAVFHELFDGQSDEVRFDDKAGFYRQVQKVVGEFATTVDVGEPSDTEMQLIEDEVATSTHADADSDAVSGAPEAHSAAVAADDPQNAEAASLDLQTNPLDGLISVLQGVQIETKPDGGLRVEADAASAKVLAQVFRGFSQMFAGIK